MNDGVDEGMLVRYLRYQYVPEPCSPWRNVRRVPRGTVEVYTLDSGTFLRSESFEQPSGDPLLTPAPKEEWVDRAHQAISLSVERQMVSDRPLGVFLSGGIDSTLISSYAAEIHPRLRGSASASQVGRATNVHI